jgi:hypothetical protein
MKINKNKIQYIEFMSKLIIDCLENISKLKEDYIYHNSDRAKFKRLRLELTKELLNIEKEIY